MSDKFEKLLAAATDPDKAELTLAFNGRVTAMRAYNTRPGKETKGDYDAARAMFDETVERFTARYFPEDAAPPEGERFKNRIQALNWLQSQGYKISQGKFYQDCKAGFPAIHRDGSISRYQAMQYGQQLDVERRSATPVDMSARKEELEVQKLELEIEKRQIENRANDDEWLRKEKAYAELAALIGTLRDSLRHQCHVGSAHIVHLAGNMDRSCPHCREDIKADPSRAPEVYEGMEEILARAFNDVLQAGRIEGMFEEKENDAAGP